MGSVCWVCWPGGALETLVYREFVIVIVVILVTHRVSAQGRAPSKSKGARPFGERPLSEGRAPVLINLMLFSPKIQKNHFFLNRTMIFIGHCHP